MINKKNRNALTENPLGPILKKPLPSLETSLIQIFHIKTMSRDLSPILCGDKILENTRGIKYWIDEQDAIFRINTYAEQLDILMQRLEQILKNVAYPMPDKDYQNNQLAGLKQNCLSNILEANALIKTDSELSDECKTKFILTHLKTIINIEQNYLKIYLALEYSWVDKPNRLDQLIFELIIKDIKEPVIRLADLAQIRLQYEIMQMPSEWELLGISLGKIKHYKRKNTVKNNLNY